MPSLHNLRWANQLLSTASNYNKFALSKSASHVRIAFALSAGNHLRVAWSSRSTDTVQGPTRPDVDQSNLHSGSHHGDDHHPEDPQATWQQEPVTPIVTRGSYLKWPYYLGAPPVPSYRGAADFANEHKFEIAIAKIIRWIFWWTFWYNILLEPGHVIGEYFIPNRYKMTDAELGIPSID